MANTGYLGGGPRTPPDTRHGLSNCPGVRGLGICRGIYIWWRRRRRRSSPYPPLVRCAIYDSACKTSQDI